MGNKFYSMLCAISFVSVLLFTFVHVFKKNYWGQKYQRKTTDCQNINLGMIYALSTAGT